MRYCPSFCIPLYASLLGLIFATNCRQNLRTHPPLPAAYKQGGAFIKSLPYFNPDSCVLLVKRDVPKHWQSSVYENLFLDGPEDSPLELGFKHLDYLEQNFPADSVTEFAQLWRGRLLIHLDKPDSAAVFLQKAFESASRAGRFLIASDAQSFKSTLFHKQGKTAEAIRAQLAIYALLEPLDSSQNDRKFVALCNLASAYSQSNQNREALKWQQKALLLAKENSHNPEFSGDEAAVMHRLSVIYLRSKQIDSALLCEQRVLELHPQDPTKTELSDIFLQFGKIYFEKNDCPTALGYFRSAWRAMNPSSPKSSPDVLHIEMAKAYQCVGRLDSAEIHLRAALPLVQKQPTQLSIAYTTLSEVLEKKGNFREAYEALNASRKIREKFYTPEKVAEMVSVKNELELERAELKAADLENKNRIAQQRNLITGLVSALALALLIGLFLQQRGQKRILEQEKELAEAVAELNARELENSKLSLKNTQQELGTANHLLKIKEQLIEEMQLQFRSQNASSRGDASPEKSPGEALELRNMKILTENDWAKFRGIFEQAFPNLLPNLRTQFPNLTNAETRLFLLCKLRFSNHEIAETLGISPKSVWRSRHRLAKKLGLPETGALDSFAQEFE